jgi:deaminated glutathione amidase
MSAPEPSPVAIAVAQFAPVADEAENLETIERLAGDAANRGALLVVLPEYSSYFSTTMPGAEAVAHAQGLHGPFVRALAELAAELGVHLVAGMIERVEGETERVANTVVALSPGAELVAHYRKLHLYDAFGARESDWIVPGPVEEPAVFPFAGFTVGLQTCYDLRFPEVTRRLVDGGADLVAVPSEWVRGPLKEAHWRTLATARAIENTIYVAAADHAPPVGVGSSLILDPMGVEVAALGEQDGEVAVAWIAPERVAAVRKVNPALRLRRLPTTPGGSAPAR